MSHRLATGSVFTAAMVLYCLTLSPDVYTEGSGELIGATYLLGTPHPTGYPLFALLGRVVAIALPLNSPALEINVATALFAALASAMLTQLLLIRGMRAPAAMAGGFALATGRVFWSQAVIAEVYGLFILATLVALTACLVAADDSSRRSRLLAGYLCGVAATTHLQAILALPMAAVVALRPAWLQARRRGKYPVAEAAPFVGGGLMGISLWLYLPLRTGRGSGFHWADVSSFGGLWDHLTAADYRSSFFSSSAAAMMRNTGRFLEVWSQEWSIIGVMIGVVGIARLWRADRSLLALIGSAIGLNLLLALNYHRDPAGLDVFFLLALVGGGLLIGCGADALMRRWHKPALVGLLALAVLLSASRFSQVDRSWVRLPGQYGRDVLACLPPHAVLLAEGDDVAFVLDYLQRVEGLRRDVKIFNRQGRGSDLATEGNGSKRQRARTVAETDLWRKGEDLYVLVPRSPPEKGLRFVPFGLVYRIEGPRSVQRTPPPVVDAASRLQSASTKKSWRLPDTLLAERKTDNLSIEESAVLWSVDPWLSKLAANYWWMAGEGYRGREQIQEALGAYRRAGRIAPISQSTQYNVAVMLLRYNELEEAFKVIQKAIDIDPVRPGPYRLAARILEASDRKVEMNQLYKRAQFWGALP